MKTKIILALTILSFLLIGCGSTNPNAPRIFFTNLEDGTTLQSPVVLQWDSENFTIEAAGEVRENAGHLHIMVDTECVAAGEVVPNDEQHLHFGKAQLETELELSSGAHTLCLQAADGEHKALPGDGMTQVISITVEE